MISASRKKTHVKKGDQVAVISGNSKGESGRVLQVLVQKNRVIVEGVHKIKKHAQKSRTVRRAASSSAKARSTFPTFGSLKPRRPPRAKSQPRAKRPRPRNPAAKKKK